MAASRRRDDREGVGQVGREAGLAVAREGDVAQGLGGEEAGALLGEGQKLALEPP